MGAKGDGLVRQPGAFTPPGALKPGKHDIKIKALNPENGYDAAGKPRPGEHVMAECVYPDGFTKEHQVKTIDDLLPKIVNQLRGRYGATEVKLIQIPDLKAGTTLTVEV